MGAGGVKNYSSSRDVIDAQPRFQNKFSKQIFKTNFQNKDFLSFRQLSQQSYFKLELYRK
jgi:hypothetical protein